MAIKNFVLDTNVLLHDPEAIRRFQENNVILPISVIEEIDKFKKDMNEVGRNARHISRILDELRAQQGSLHKGIKLETGGTLRIELGDEELTEILPAGLKKTYNDNRIVSVALDIQKKTKASKRFKNRQTILVTKDTNLRIKADALGLIAEDYEHGKVQFDELYTGKSEIYVSPDVIAGVFRKDGAPVDLDLLPNQYLTLIDSSDPSHRAIGRYCGKSKRIVPVWSGKKDVWGILSRNLDQQFALDALLDDNIKIVTLVGKAGTGKTLLAIAAGMSRMDDSVYHRMLVSRPVIPLGKDIGFLPGDINEKLSPWMQPIFDNFDYLLHTHEPDGKKSKGYKELQAMGTLEIEPLTYIRGRSIPNQYMIVDEAQNLTPHEVKTIVTRAGEGTKIIMTGDPYQIDNPYVDAESNGLSYLIEKLKGENISAHVTLCKGERSELAEIAANLL